MELSERSYRHVYGNEWYENSIVTSWEVELSRLWFFFVHVPLLNWIMEVLLGLKTTPRLLNPVSDYCSWEDKHRCTDEGSGCPTFELLVEENCVIVWWVPKEVLEQATSASCGNLSTIAMARCSKLMEHTQHAIIQQLISWIPCHDLT